MFYSAFDVLTFAIDMLSDDINDLHVQILSSLDNRLSMTLVTTDMLYNALSDVQRKLPLTLELPYPVLKSKMFKYYDILKVTLVPTVDAFNLLMSVPLIQKSALFDVYRLVTLPLLTLDGMNTVHYDLNSDYFAISHDRHSSILLTNADVHLCNKKDIMFCQFHKASLSTGSSPSCISSLFLRESKNIGTYCKTVPQPLPHSPIVKFLTRGNWFIFTPIDLIMDIVYLSSDKASVPTTLKLYKGENDVTLPSKCSGVSKYFSLPYYLRNETGYKVRHTPGDSLDLSKYLLNNTKFNFSLTHPKSMIDIRMLSIAYITIFLS